MRPSESVWYVFEKSVFKHCYHRTLCHFSNRKHWCVSLLRSTLRKETHSPQWLSTSTLSRSMVYILRSLFSSSCSKCTKARTTQNISTLFWPNVFFRVSGFLQPSTLSPYYRCHRFILTLYSKFPGSQSSVHFQYWKWSIHFLASTWAT